MRKELTKIFKGGKTKRKAFWISSAVVLFIILNGFFVYFYNPNNYYFFIIKKIIPYPSMVIGNKIITFSSLDDKISEDRKIYEVAYRINFISGMEGKKNLDILKQNAKEEIIDGIIMENLLKGEGADVSSADVKKEYENITKNIGDDKEILNILKYSSGLSGNDIKDKIYQNLLKERTKNDFLYNLKMKAILIKPEDPNKKEDWDKALQKSNDIFNEIKDGESSFDQNYALYGDKNDAIVQNFGKDIYFGDELPNEIKDVFYDLKIGQVNEPVKADNGYYIFNVYEKKGYFKESFDDFINEQKKKIRILSFSH